MCIFRVHGPKWWTVLTIMQGPRLTANVRSAATEGKFGACNSSGKQIQKFYRGKAKLNFPSSFNHLELNNQSLTFLL